MWLRFWASEVFLVPAIDLPARELDRSRVCASCAGESRAWTFSGCAPMPRSTTRLERRAAMLRVAARMLWIDLGSSRSKFDGESRRDPKIIRIGRFLVGIFLRMGGYITLDDFPRTVGGTVVMDEDLD